MAAAERFGYFLALAVVVPLILLMMIAPIFVISALFVVGAVAWGIYSMAWLLVQGIRVAVPATAAALVRAASLTAEGVKGARALPGRVALRPCPADLVSVRVTRIEGLCPLGHLWQHEQSFIVGFDGDDMGMPCEKARRLISAGGLQMMRAGRADETIRCVGAKHLIEFRLERVRAAALPV